MVDIQWLCPFPKNNMQVTGMYALKIAAQLMTFEPPKPTHTHMLAQQDKDINRDYPELQWKMGQHDNKIKK